MTRLLLLVKIVRSTPGCIIGTRIPRRQMTPSLLKVRNTFRKSPLTFPIFLMRSASRPRQWWTVSFIKPRVRKNVRPSGPLRGRPLTLSFLIPKFVRSPLKKRWSMSRHNRSGR